MSSGTVPLMKGPRVRGHLWAFIFLAVRRLLELVVLVVRSEESKEVELLVLRQEVALLRDRWGVPPMSRPIERCWPC